MADGIIQLADNPSEGQNPLPSGPKPIRLHFPVTKWACTATIVEQAHKVLEEAAELAVESDGAFDGGAPDLERVAEEAWDAIQAAETMLGVLSRQGVKICEAREAVQRKNRDRGYYDHKECS
jgi:hypothetical protein